MHAVIIIYTIRYRTFVTLLIPQRELWKQWSRGSTWRSFHFIVWLKNQIGFSKTVTVISLFWNAETLYSLPIALPIALPTLTLPIIALPRGFISVLQFFLVTNVLNAKLTHPKNLYSKVVRRSFLRFQNFGKFGVYDV